MTPEEKCLSKRSFPDRESAQAFDAANRKRYPKKKQTAYLCWVCCRWHLTNNMAAKIAEREARAKPEADA